MCRPRRTYVFALLLTGIAGILSRKWLLLFHVLHKGAGDALWATAVYLVLCLIWPRWKTPVMATAAILISFADEFSQMYQAPWIDHIRATALGHLFLGSGFSVKDLPDYVIGVALAVLIDGRLLAVAARQGPGAPAGD